MITRPLDLAARLRPAPPSLDWLFFVNVALLGLFFALFGSPFVLAPGLGVDFQLPMVANAKADARPATHYITVVNAGQIFAGDGLRNMEQLREWLHAQAKTAKQPSLLVLASRSVPVSVFMDIAGAARAEGFSVQVAGTEPSATEAPRF
jgi:biopolymer transport protein ExbD